MFTEKWDLIWRGTDDETGLPSCLIAREKFDVQTRLTVWKLVKYNDGWRSVAQQVSTGKWRRFPERRGVKLTASRTDRTLHDYAEGVK